MIDLRSDTVTQPTAAMRQVIAAAEVGDDVYHDDPSVLALEARVAELLGKDDAMYVPTGTMSNQTAIRAQTSPGDVVLAGRDAHIDTHEVGAANAVSGVTIRQLGDDGTFTAADVEAEVPPASSSMPPWLFQPVSLVAAENSHNGAGGIVWRPAQLVEVTTAAHRLGLATHLDGARLWNAAVATGVHERDLAAGFDTVSVCFSKGLGAPMGSALVGTAEVIQRARRLKQMLGGGFRQAGMMAAAALHAVEHHRERLADDHANAARLARGLAETPGIEIDPDRVVTNMVYFDVTSMPAEAFTVAWLADGVAALPLGPRTVRAVTHLGVDVADIDAALRSAVAVLGA